MIAAYISILDNGREESRIRDYLKFWIYHHMLNSARREISHEADLPLALCALALELHVDHHEALQLAVSVVELHTRERFEYDCRGHREDEEEDDEEVLSVQVALQACLGRNEHSGKRKSCEEEGCQGRNVELVREVGVVDEAVGLGGIREARGGVSEEDAVGKESNEVNMRA